MKRRAHDADLKEMVVIRSPSPQLVPFKLHRFGQQRRVALDRVSPALRAGASNFSLRGQRKVTKRKATPANPLASPVPSVQSQRRTGRRRRHFGLRHPWLRPKSASNILVLAPNRGRAVLALLRFGPCPLRLRHHP